MKEIHFICDVCKKKVGFQKKKIPNLEEKYLYEIGDFAEVCLSCFDDIRDMINREALKYKREL